MTASPPILFNHLKHHLGAVHLYIETEKTNHYTNLLCIGASQADFYIGDLQLNDIREEILQKLSNMHLSGKEEYVNWLQENGGFQQVALSDGSIWILLEGTDADCYIHIHPGRYSPHTIRIKASTLKTAIALCCAGVLSPKDISTEKVNVVRRDLKLSPIREVKDAATILEAVQLILGILN